MRKVNFPKLIRWHFQIHAAPYQLALFSALALITAAGTAVWFQHRGQRRSLEERSWPLAEGLILESEITETDSSTEHSFSTNVSASGRLRYLHPTGEITAPFFLQSSSLPPRDWQANFSPGSRPVFRYNPSNPKELSFIDFLGHP